MFSLEKLDLIFSKAMNGVPQGNIGIAVSGGGDSLALLHLSANWAYKNERKLKSATVDHGLRDESMSECDYVKKISSELLIEHSTLKWLKKPLGNLQNSARDARHRLLFKWQIKESLSVVLLGHTLDDNAETILIRISRGSGIDGLVGMSESKNINRLKIFRPLLTVTREDLREYLRVKGVEWIDEPSNFDERFQRVKMRKLLPKLSEVGLSAEKLISVASHMARAKEALDLEVLRFARSYVKQQPWGGLEIQYESFISLCSEYQFRLLSAALRWISGNIYRPRFKRLKKLTNLILECGDFKGVSLMGCIIKCNKEKIILNREYVAISNRKAVSNPSFIWDKKWHVTVDHSKIEHGMVGPLGKSGLSQIEIKRKSKIPISALIASVALFHNKQVVCLPVLSYGEGLTSDLIGGTESFLNFLATY